MPTALITGAAGGIGSAIAEALAPTHPLLLAGRPSARLDALAERFDATTLRPRSRAMPSRLGERRRRAGQDSRRDDHDHFAMSGQGSVVAPLT